MFDQTAFDSKLDKALEHIRKDLATLRTGRASSQLLDPVMVEAYGTRMKIAELANVSAPDPNMLIVAPWDKNLLAAIEKAIASAQLNLNPVVDGEIVRIVVPALTQERREEMVKILHQKTEAGRVMLRSLRIDAKKEIEDGEDEAGVSEDDIKAQLEDMDKAFKDCNVKLDNLAKDKEKDLMTV